MGGWSTVMEPEWVLAGVNVVPCDGYFNKHIDKCVCVRVLSSLFFLFFLYKRNVHVLLARVVVMLLFG